jgi:hypothetical protein
MFRLHNQVTVLSAENVYFSEERHVYHTVKHRKMSIEDVQIYLECFHLGNWNAF